MSSLKLVAAPQSLASMPSARTFAAYVVIVVAIVGAAGILWRIADVLVLAFAGIVLATALRALALPLSRRLRMAEVWSVALVVILILAVLGAGGWLFGTQIGGQLGELSQRLPQAAERFQGWLGQSYLGGLFKQAASDTAGSHPGAIAGLAKFATTTFGAVANMLLIFFLGLYFAVDPDLYFRGGLRLVPPQRREETAAALMAAGESLRKWLLGQVISMLSVGVVTGVGLWLLGVPLALALGFIAGVLEFVPIVGPIVAAVPGILLAFTVGPMLALYTLLLYIAIHQAEGNIIMPVVQRWAVALPPALGLLSVVAFGLLFGMLGVLFATPLAVVVMVLVERLYVKEVLEAERPEAPVRSAAGRR